MRRKIDPEIAPSLWGIIAVAGEEEDERNKAE
jgi:hypothetical protein